MLAVEPDSGMNRSTNNNSPVSFKDNTSPLKRQHPVSSVLDSHNHLQQGLQEQSPLPSDHYIHSRLKSALGSGRKEVYYSGVLEGGRVRRVASLNAQAMNQMLCLTESALSVPNPRTDSPSVDSTLPPQDVDVLCTPLNGSLHNCKFPINFETKQALPDRTTSSLSDESSSSEEAISDTIMSSPLTSPSSSSTTAAATTTALLMPTVSPESTVKKASVDVVDVMKKRVRKQRNTALLMPTVSPESTVKKASVDVVVAAAVVLMKKGKVRGLDMIVSDIASSLLLLSSESDEVVLSGSACLVSKFIGNLQLCSDPFKGVHSTSTSCGGRVESTLGLSVLGLGTDSADSVKQSI